jgi:hypothetical protein
MSLLVAVQSVARGRNAYPPAIPTRLLLLSEEGDEAFATILGLDQRDADTGLPGGLDEPPASLDLFLKIRGDVLVGEAEELGGQPDRFRRTLLLMKEAHAFPTASQIVEGIQHVSEPELHRDVAQLVIRVLALKAFLALLEEGALLEGALLGGVLQVAAKGCGVRQSEFVQPDQVVLSVAQGQQRLGKGKLVGSRVLPEEDHGSPVLIHGRSRGKERFHRCLKITAQGIDTDESGLGLSHLRTGSPKPSRRAKDLLAAKPRRRSGLRKGERLRSVAILLQSTGGS